MKTLKGIIGIIALIFTVQMAQSQAVDYKGHRIDATGKITDADGKHVGNVTKEGIITNTAGEKVAYTDSTGSLIDGKTGKNLGKVGKDGNFVSYSATETWIVSAPENGMCLIKDKDGKVKAVVHETYKNIGACAVYCLAHGMTHGAVLDESKASTASYVCPMHPDATSDKPGKCSKCGMDLVKKSK